MRKQSRRARRGGSRNSQYRGRSFLDRLSAVTLGDAWEGAGQLAKAAGSLIASNTEVKIIDAGVAPTATSWAGVVTPVSLCAQGDDINGRTGNTIRLHGMELRAVAESAASTINGCRTILVADTACQGATPAAADILASVGAAGAPLSPFAFANVHRFDVLYDSGPVYLSPGGEGTWSVQAVLPLNFHVNYTGAAGAIANSLQNNLFLLQISDIAAAGPVMGFTSRVHFVDN
jgi:hypothetical protein